MKYYLKWNVDEYSSTDDEFDDEDSLLEHMNKYSECISRFGYRLVYGKEIKVKEYNVVTKFDLR